MSSGAAGLKDKAIIMMLWQSGLRNGSFRGLTVGHVREGLSKNEVPLKIDMTPDIEKMSLGDHTTPS